MITDSGRDASLVVAALESCLEAIKRRHPELPDALINIELRGRAAAFFAASTWITRRGEAAAIAFSRRALLQPAQSVFAILLHEVAHGLASARGIKDTSRQGRYHNKKFEKCAKELGLIVGKRDERYGFTHTSLPTDTRLAYEIEIASLERALTIFPNRQSLHRRRQVPPPRVHVRCRCGRHLRLLLAFAKEAPIICGRCGSTFSRKRRALSLRRFPG